MDQALFLRGREQICAVAREAHGQDRVGEEFGVGVDAAVRDLSGGQARDRVSVGRWSGEQRNGPPTHHRLDTRTIQRREQPKVAPP